MADDLFRNDDRDRQEAEQMAAVRRHNLVNLKALLLTLAVAVAPFLALLFSVNLALGVLAAGLLFTSLLAWWGSTEAGPAQRSQIRLAGLLNFAVFLTVVGVLVLRLRAG